MDRRTDKRTNKQMEICISWAPFGAKKIFSLGAWETFWESTLLFSHGSTNIVLTHGMIEYASPSSLQVTRPSRPSPSPASWPPPRPKPTLWRKLRLRHLRCISGLASLLVKLSYLVECFTLDLLFCIQSEQISRHVSTLVLIISLALLILSILLRTVQLEPKILCLVS